MPKAKMNRNQRAKAAVGALGGGKRARKGVFKGITAARKGAKAIGGTRRLARLKCLVDYGYPNLKSEQKAPAAAAPPAQVEPRATRNSGKESGKDTKAAEPLKVQYVCPKCRAQHVEHQRKLCHSCREASDQQRTAKKQKTK